MATERKEGNETPSNTGEAIYLIAACLSISISLAVAANGNSFPSHDRPRTTHSERPIPSPPTRFSATFTPSQPASVVGGVCACVPRCATGETVYLAGTACVQLRLPPASRRR